LAKDPEDLESATWPNCIAKLHWTESHAKKMISIESATILQRRQNLGDSVKEAKQVAKDLGIKFVDNTNKPPEDPPYKSIPHDDFDMG